MLGQTLNKIFGSRNDIKDQKNTLKNLCISICSNPFTVTTQEYLHILMVQNHPFPENQANQLLANCNKTTKRNTKETSFFS